MCKSIDKFFEVLHYFRSPKTFHNDSILSKCILVYRPQFRPRFNESVHVSELCQFVGENVCVCISHFSTSMTLYRFYSITLAKKTTTRKIHTVMHFAVVTVLMTDAEARGWGTTLWQWYQFVLRTHIHAQKTDLSSIRI